MKVDIKGLLTGINNSIFVKEQIELVAEERLAICKNCPYYSPNAIASGLIQEPTIRKDAFCIDCGCNMHLKTRYLSAFCPLGSEHSHFPDEKSKWGSLTDDQAANKLLETKDIMEDMNKYKIDLMNNKIVENGTQEKPEGDI